MHPHHIPPYVAADFTDMWLKFLKICGCRFYRYVAAATQDMCLHMFTHICGCISFRYVAKDPPDMWQQILHMGQKEQKGKMFH